LIEDRAVQFGPPALGEGRRRERREEQEQQNWGGEAPRHKRTSSLNEDVTAETPGSIAAGVDLSEAVVGVPQIFVKGDSRK
jgi:hypothetical protein